jgi:hypothetical protein
LAYSFLRMSHYVKCSLLLFLSCHSFCGGCYKYNCLIIVTTSDIYEICSRHFVLLQKKKWTRKDSSVFCHQERMTKCLPINSPVTSPQLTPRTRRHELSSGHAVRPLDSTHLECKVMLKSWPSPFSASQPC